MPRKQSVSIKDGRRQRGEDSRRKIVSALLEIVKEGTVFPQAEDVAKRARVGVRTVFRHFDNMEQLFLEMSRRMMAEILPMAEKPLTPGPWQDQLRELLTRRVQIFERILPLRVASDAHRPNSPFLQQSQEWMSRYQRNALGKILPESVRNDPVRMEAFDLVFSLDSWRRLRMEQKLSVRRARTVLEGLATHLMAWTG